MVNSANSSGFNDAVAITIRDTRSFSPAPSADALLGDVPDDVLALILVMSDLECVRIRNVAARPWTKDIKCLNQEWHCRPEDTMPATFRASADRDDASGSGDFVLSWTALPDRIELPCHHRLETSRQQKPASVFRQALSHQKRRSWRSALAQTRVPRKRYCFGCGDCCGRHPENDPAECTWTCDRVQFKRTNRRLFVVSLLLFVAGIIMFAQTDSDYTGQSGWDGTPHEDRLLALQSRARTRIHIWVYCMIALISVPLALRCIRCAQAHQVEPPCVQIQLPNWFVGCFWFGPWMAWRYYNTGSSWDLIWCSLVSAPMVVFLARWIWVLYKDIKDRRDREYRRSNGRLECNFGSTVDRPLFRVFRQLCCCFCTQHWCAAA